ncbi:MAG: hypothetical protein Alpg2KO_15850 [Alphaproteobacteria bacterium]
MIIRTALASLSVFALLQAQPVLAQGSGVEPVAQNPAAEALVGNVPNVIKGKAVVANADSLEVDGRKILLYGIIPPQAGSSAAGVAKQLLEQLTVDYSTETGSYQKVVTCKVYGMLEADNTPVALCGTRDHSDLGRALLTAGFAQVDKQVLQEPELIELYTRAETDARIAAIGIWNPAIANAPAPAPAETTPVEAEALEDMMAGSTVETAEVDASAFDIPPAPRGKPEEMTAADPASDPVAPVETATAGALPVTPVITGRPGTETLSRAGTVPIQSEGAATEGERYADTAMIAPGSLVTQTDLAMMQEEIQRTIIETISSRSANAQAVAPEDQSWFGRLFGGLFNFLDRFQLLIFGGIMFFLIKRLHQSSLRAALVAGRKAEQRLAWEKQDRSLGFLTALQAEANNMVYALTERSDLTRLAAKDEPEDIPGAIAPLRLRLPSIFDSWHDVGALGYRAASAIRIFTASMTQIELKLAAVEYAAYHGDPDDSFAGDFAELADAFEQAAQDARNLKDLLHDMAETQLHQNADAAMA